MRSARFHLPFSIALEENAPSRESQMIDQIEACQDYDCPYHPQSEWEFPEYKAFSAFLFQVDVLLDVHDDACSVVFGI